jgi:mono/diheme cytochrome c family protein
MIEGESMTRRPAFTYLFACTIGAVSLLFCFGTGPAAQEPQVKPETELQYVPLIASVEGKDLYRHYCASCHGTDATGHGPAAPALKVAPSDLTIIARRNSGIFPRARVRKIIAGDDEILSHGSREMPIWGPIFHQIERDRDWGLVRLENLAKYLESIQRK